MLEFIFSAIVGGLVVIIATRFAPKKSILKLFIKMVLVVKEYAFSALAESYEKFKDVLAECKAEYEVEKEAERKITSDEHDK